MKKFIGHLKKFFPYCSYATKSELKNEVANSYLAWLWWILDPLFFMLVYTFIVQFVFKTNVEFLPVFVFAGLTVWNFFNKCIVTSVKIVAANKGIISQRYIPKYILVMQKIGVNFVKYIISFLLLIVLALIFKVHITWKVIYIIPLTFLLTLLSFGLSNIFAHFGVFVDDLANVIQVILRLMFYLSGVFYSIGDRLSPQIAKIFYRVNPMAYIINDFRDVFMYNIRVNYSLFFYWLGISIVLTIISIRTIYKYENTYLKVI